MIATSKFSLTAGFLCLFAVILPTGARADQLVTNGGFETGDFTGWTVNDPSSLTFVAASPFDGMNASSGNWFAALGSSPADGFLSQTLLTVANQTYTISFFLASDEVRTEDGSLSNDFSLQFGSDTLFSVNNLDTQGMTQYSYTDTATSGLTLLQISERNDPGFLGLDDVSVTSADTTPTDTPEPATYDFMLVGLLGLIAASWKRGSDSNAVNRA